MCQTDQAKKARGSFFCRWEKYISYALSKTRRDWHLCQRIPPQATYLSSGIQLAASQEKKKKYRKLPRTAVAGTA